MRPTPGLDGTLTCMDGILYGPETRNRLGTEARSAFDAEWRQLLAIAERDFDLEPLVLAVLRWWRFAGGDQETADATRAEYTRWSSRRDLDSELATGGAVCGCTGSEVFEALNAPQQVMFEEQWQAAIREAAEESSWRQLQSHVTQWFVETQTTDEDRARMDAERLELEAALEEGRVEYWQPS